MKYIPKHDDIGNGIPLSPRLLKTTVAELIRALDDEHSLRIPPRLHANRATCRTCALLATLKGEK